MTAGMWPRLKMPFTNALNNSLHMINIKLLVLPKVLSIIMTRSILKETYLQLILCVLILTLVTLVNVKASHTSSISRGPPINYPFTAVPCSFCQLGWLLCNFTHFMLLCRLVCVYRTHSKFVRTSKIPYIYIHLS